jgi:murein L,D-transpeptidase YafK
MSLISLGLTLTSSALCRGLAVAAAMGAAGWLGACSQTELPPHLKPLSKDTMMLLGKKGMATTQPIFVRVLKQESELEVWKQRDDGRFYHFKTYPICHWSGDVGPKVSQGDKQAPEGFYSISRHQMNPNSQFHLAFNLGYPNAFDKAHRRTGEFLMVHGKCKSAGCYAMTDALIEEIYALAREAFIGGQETFEVHAFPFRMTDENLERHKKHEHYRFWATLKQGYDYFETTRQLPKVAVCERRYVVNVKWRGPEPARLDPERACPAFEHPPVEPFVPAPKDQIADAERIMAPGPKTRAIAVVGGGSAPAGSGPSAGGWFGLGFGSWSKASTPALSLQR